MWSNPFFFFFFKILISKCKKQVKKSQIYYSKCACDENVTKICNENVVKRNCIHILKNRRKCAHDENVMKTLRKYVTKTLQT